ncbi:hypothetical protein ACLF6K_06875 [Streptomyces xanthophaeus]|uniref:hypothetical protein n=1 Tax=Streptomyces xanthophaeus TaxID=67385 RepID=UPI00398FA942
MTTQHSTAGDTTKPAGASQDDMELFMDRFGDVIDDRVAEIVEEVIAEVVAARSTRRRPRPSLLLAAFIVALIGVSVLLRDSPAVVATMWIAGAVMCTSLNSQGHAAHRSTGRPVRMPW